MAYVFIIVVLLTAIALGVQTQIDVRAFIGVNRGHGADPRRILRLTPMPPLIKIS
jgi:hypothetical protein